MRILGIETSCDETAISIIDVDSNQKITVLSNVINSQIEIHKPYGGVFPTLAKREHAKNLVPVLIEALEKSNLLKFKNEKNQNISEEDLKNNFAKEPELAKNFSKIFEIEKPNIDLIAITEGPGLEPALWVGIQFAKTLSTEWQIPLLPINHMEGHIVSVLNKDKKINFPSIALLISGGHTELIKVNNIGNYELIGQTKDDAVGEAFDKVARILGLSYPGGPQISKLAEMARDENLENFILDSNGEKIEIKLPRPMIDSPDLNFSFSGLKTAVLYLVQKIERQDLMNEKTKKIIAREFENAVCDVLIKKTEKSMQNFHTESLIIGGGVIANNYLRKVFSEKFNNLYIPEKDVITDNAQMIAIAGYFKSLILKPEIGIDLKANGNLTF